MCPLILSRLVSLYIYLFIFDCAGSSLRCVGFSLVAASWGYSVVAVHGPLIAVAFLVAEHGL